MLELANFSEEKKRDPTPENYQVKKLKNITFIGLFNSFNSTQNLLAKLKEQGSIDILTVKNDLTRAKEQVFEIYLVIDSILNSYQNGFNIETDSMKCDFCPEVADTYREFHKWCKDCFSREFGGKVK